MAVVLAQPALEVEVVKLLAPEHSAESLPVYPPLIFGQGRRRNARVEFIRFGDPLLERGFKAAEGIGRGRRRQAGAGRSSFPARE